MSPPSEFDPPLLPRVSRRKFIATGMMLPLVRIAHASDNKPFGESEQSSLGGAGAKEADDMGIPVYPGALVGFWCALEDRQKSDSHPSWLLEIPVGWL
jgi:hypothetical protein